MNSNDMTPYETLKKELFGLNSYKKLSKVLKEEILKAYGNADEGSILDFIKEIKQIKQFELNNEKVKFEKFKKLAEDINVILKELKQKSLNDLRNKEEKIQESQIQEVLNKLDQDTVKQNTSVSSHSKQIRKLIAIVFTIFIFILFLFINYENLLKFIFG